MRILDRHITKSLIGIFLSSLLVFFFLYLVIDIFSNLGDFLEQGFAFQNIRDYYLSFFPVIFSQTAPFACLIAALFCLGKLNNNNEIIAMRTAGLNFWQITKSAICFGMVVSAVIFAFNEKVIPQAIATSNSIKEAIARKEQSKEKKEVIRHLTFYGLKNRLYFIDTFNPNDNSLEGVTILEQDKNQNLKAKIVALKGFWINKNWKFQQCQIFYFDVKGQMEDRSLYLEEKDMDITESPQDFLRQRIQVNSMNIRQIKEYLDRFSDSGAGEILNNLRVDLNQKIAYPLSNLAIMFVGMPLALMTKRRKGLTVTQLGIFISTGFFYYVLNAIGLALGKGGILDPILSAWLANIIFFLFSAYLIVKIR